MGKLRFFMGKLRRNYGFKITVGKSGLEQTQKHIYLAGITVGSTEITGNYADYADYGLNFGVSYRYPMLSQTALRKSTIDSSSLASEPTLTVAYVTASGAAEYERHPESAN